MTKTYVLKDTSKDFPTLIGKTFTLSKDKFGTTPKMCRFIDAFSKELLLEAELVPEMSAAATSEDGTLFLRFRNGERMSLQPCNA